MPVYKLTNEMSYEEFLGWLNYFERRPPGWQDDDRAYKLMKVQGCEQKPEVIFPSLDKIYNTSKPILKEGMISGENLKQSVMFQKMLSAKNGDKVDFL